MTSQPGRALAWVRTPYIERTPSISTQDLREMGWQADDLASEEVILPFRDFPSLEAAKTSAARDLPAGTTVNWGTLDRRLRGGFIVGHDGVAPPLGELLPAFVLWPDHSESRVETHVQLAGLLRDRLDWLVELALGAGLDASEVKSGRDEALRTLAELEAGGQLSPSFLGPYNDVRCVAKVEPLAWIRWDGFREGWDRPDGPPVNERRHAVQYEYEGEFQRFWRDALREGIVARQQTST
jgi:hypothetical protein